MNSDSYKVCERCDIINKAENERCWRCGFEEFHDDVEAGIEKLKHKEWGADEFDEDDLNLRYVTVDKSEESMEGV